VEDCEGKIMDLLDDQQVDSNKKKYQPKKIYDVPMEHAVIGGLIEVEVRSAEEALDIFRRGQRRRTTRGRR
jgi:hypothetical protein